jgi:transposase, IS5 family
MSEREVGQLSFADGLVSAVGPSNPALERLSGLVDWPAVEKLLSGLRSARVGAPGYPALVLFKALLLQRLYDLSDPGLEEAIADRLSFRRFLGLSLSDAVPDHSTLWRFRELLGRSGLGEQAFGLIGGQLERSGLVLKQGTMIDASLIRAAVNPPPRPAEPLPPDADGRPASKLVRSALDPEAAWTRKEGRYVFGYKAHIAMDEGSRILRGVALTPANVNDSVVADALICGDEGTVWADKAYENKKRSVRLREQGIRDGIARRANRWHALGPWAVRRNVVIARRRGTVEAMFALLKTVFGFARARYRGIRRNATALYLAAIAMNLQRAARLVPATP